MRYLIIGLGIYGSNLARDLTDMGHEIVGVDNCKANIDAIKDYISTVYYIDATEESELALLPIKNVDLVIVAIGENFGASVKVVALLKKMQVKHIFARAIDTLHESILKGFDIDRILTPEQRAARDLTNEMGLGSRIQSISVDETHFVLKFAVPETLVGLKYSDLALDKNFRFKVIAVTQPVVRKNVLGVNSVEQEMFDFNAAEAVISSGDVITCFGSRTDYNYLYKQLRDL